MDRAEVTALVRGGQQRVETLIRQLQDLPGRVTDLETYDAALDGRLDTLETVESWTAVGSFSNSWANFGGSEAVAAYYKDPWGVVHVRGVIKSGTVGSAAFTLPTGYRPPTTQRFAVNANGAFGYVAVTSAGNVVPAVGSNVEVNLAGISFRNQ